MAGNNKIRITYDPYQHEIRCEYKSAAGTTWEALQAGGKLAEMFSHGSRKDSLQNCAQDIVNGIKNDFCSSGQGVDLVFCGTEEDWEDLKEVVEQDPDSKITCVGSAGQLAGAKDILSKIKGIFQDLSHDFEGLTKNDEVKKPIDQFLTTVKPDVVLYVSGTYSTGKSTFINALIGEELLPSAIDPTTAHIFKIEALPEGNWTDIKIRFKYQKQETELSFNQDGYALENLNQLPDKELKTELDEKLAKVEHGPVYVREALAILNRFGNTPAEENPVSPISSEIEVSAPFYNTTLPLKDYHIIIYDTPGTNAANHKDHLAVMQESLKEQTNGLPILLVTPTQTDATEVEELRNEIHKIGGALDESNILVVVTQADKETFAGLKKAHQNQRKAAFKNAGKRICYTSAAMGFYSKTGRYPTMGIESEEDQEENLEKLESNSTPYKNGRTRLYMIDSLPHAQMKTICEEGDLANETDSESTKLLHNSGLWAIEREIERFAQRFASYNKCWQAKGYLSKAIGAAKDVQNEEQRRVFVLKSRDEKTFRKQKNDLIIQINENCGTWKDHNFEVCTDKLEEIKNKKFIPFTTGTINHLWTQINKESLFPLYEFRRWASEVVDSRVRFCEESMEAFAVQFWAEEVLNLKQSCIQIVTNSPVLTEEEKEFAQKLILNIPPIEFESVNYSLPPEVAKQKQFLIFKWNHIDPIECANDMTRKAGNFIFDFTSSYSDILFENVNSWTSGFRKALIKKLDEFSPTLKEIAKEIQAHTNKIKTLKWAQKRLKDTQQS